MKTRAILLLLYVFFSIQPVKSQLKIHHQILSLSPINSINENQFYATLGGLGHTIFTKVTLDPLNFEYIESIVFDKNMTSYALIDKTGWSVDYQGAVYTTDDGFQTTEKLTERAFKKFVKTSTGIIALGVDNKIYFSADANNWEAKAEASSMNPKGDLIWGTNESDKLLISENGGKDWTVSVDLSQFEKVQRVIELANPTTIIIREDGKRKLHITSDNGQNWKTTETLQGSTIIYNFIDANWGFAGPSNNTLATDNGGETWIGLSQIFPTLPEAGTVELWAVMQDKIFISIEGNLYYTIDKGQSWTFCHGMIGGNKYYDIDQKGKVIIIGGPQGNYAISKDGGMIFHQYKWGNLDIMAVGVIDENTYALGDRKGQVLMLYNGGDEWDKKITSSGNYNALHFETSADKMIVLSTRIGQPAISTDAAQNFKYVNVGGGNRYQTMKPNGDIIDVTQSGVISKVNTSNGQKTELVRISGANVRRISMASDNVGYVFSFKDVSTMNTYVTHDGWASYTLAGEVGIPPAAGYLSVSHIADGHVIITTDGENMMFETTDFGTNWTRKDFDLLNTFANRVSPLTGSHFSDADNYWLVTETGYLFWSNEESPITTSVTSIAKNEVQNLMVYPNPATQSISIQAKNIEISNIEIFNIRGQKVFQQSCPLSKAIDISHWTNGFYIVKTTSAKGLTNQTKFIKN